MSSPLHQDDGQVLPTGQLCLGTRGGGSRALALGAKKPTWLGGWALFGKGPQLAEVQDKQTHKTLTGINLFKKEKSTEESTLQ